MSQAGGAAGSQSGGGAGRHPARTLVPALPAPAPPDLSLLLPAEAVWKNQVSGLHQDFNPAEFLLSSLAQAASICSPITDSLKRKQPAGYRLSTAEAYESWKARRRAATGRVRSAAAILVDPAGRQDQARHPSQAKTPAMQGGSGLTMTSLIGLDVEIALGEEPISMQELEELTELKVPLVRFRGQWVEINADEIRAAAAFWRDREQVSLRDVVQTGLGADQRARDDNVSLAADGLASRSP